MAGNITRFSKKLRILLFLQMLRGLEKYGIGIPKEEICRTFEFDASKCRLKANIGLLMKLAPPQKRQKYDGYWKKFHYNSQPISLFSFATTLKGSSSSSLQKGKDGSLITRKPICIF